jgi:hypothetical protein
MTLSNWLGLAKKKRARRERPTLRVGETVAFDLFQVGNRVEITGDGVAVYFAVDGIALPAELDATFAVWAVLAIAMEQGFNIHINRPIDPQIAANAERLSQFWEMWAPGWYRSVHVSGEGLWSPVQRLRLPRVQLYSGGVDATYAMLKNGNSKGGWVATIFGIDFRYEKDERGFAKLIDRTAPLLERLNCQRIIIDTNANRKPSEYSHGFTLAACLFLLSDLFESGAFAADRTLAQDLVTFPWGTNHIINSYFSGSNFTVESVGDDVSRTEKIAALAEANFDPSFLSFCRQRRFIPDNCGVCNKCIRTKAMFLVTTGDIPEIFVDNSLDESLMRKLHLKRNERTHTFDLYFYAKEHGRVDAVPGLADLVEHYRRIDSVD